ncbi:MAG: hypothetical protein KJN64_03470 [Ignavibacteria bacterium]|nr:hypothetical protein [Ignavibacteria bacterium]
MNKSTIFIFANKPILNPEKVKLFENLNSNYTVYLNSLLYLNWIEVVSSIKNNYDVYYCMNFNDKDFIPKNFFPRLKNLLLLDNNSTIQLEETFKNLQLKNYTKYLFIFYNSIGISNEDINNTFNLLSIDNISITIGKARNDQLIFAGTNSIDQDFFEKLFAVRFEYDNFVEQIIKEDVFIHKIANNYLSINDFTDVKKLYIELSKKVSLAYCSEIMHERFNDLFVEYKDLLNE